MIGLRGQLNQVRNPTCTACSLCKSSMNVCVMGRGSPRSTWVLIGEAPGKAEAKTGKPFMGDAGQLLNQILEELGVGTPYITNICKCRPPDNRKPSLREMVICARLYLNSELRIIDPVVVVAMGRTPIDLLLPNGFDRGRVDRSYIGGKMRDVMPTWHPAYILHSGSKHARQQLKDHLRMAYERSKV